MLSWLWAKARRVSRPDTACPGFTWRASPIGWHLCLSLELCLWSSEFWRGAAFLQPPGTAGLPVTTGSRPQGPGLPAPASPGSSLPVSQCQASAGLRAVETGRQAQVCMAGAETRELEASSRGGGRGGSQRRLLGPGPENNGGSSRGKTWESLRRRGPGWQATCFRKASQNLKGGQDGRQAAVGVCDHGPGRGPVRSTPSLRHKRGWISLEHNLILDGPSEMGGSQDPGPWWVDIGAGGAGGTGVISTRLTRSGGPVIPLESSYTCRENICGPAGWGTA